MNLIGDVNFFFFWFHFLTDEKPKKKSLHLGIFQIFKFLLFFKKDFQTLEPSKNAFLKAFSKCNKLMFLHPFFLHGKPQRDFH
jgi:hypothetical protein